MELYKLEDACRYSDNLYNLLCGLDAERIIRIKYEEDYQGFMDIDVLLKDGRVFSYLYDYGSCSGCDEWEDRALSDEQIETQMGIEASYFDSIDHYNDWVKSLPDDDWRKTNVRSI